MPVMMPEGPEVASLVDSLNQRLGTTPSTTATPISTTTSVPSPATSVELKRAEIVSGRYEKKMPEGWDCLQECLGENSVKLLLSGVQTKGKFIYFTFSSHPELSIWSTLGLAGGWSFQSSRHLRLILTFERQRNDVNKAKTNEMISLYFYDARNFGTFKVCDKKIELEAKLKKLGADWLHKDPKERITMPQFVELGKNAAKRNRPLAVFLMDQSKTAGIGNYLLSEVLYLSKIHPFALCGSLDEDSWKKLYIIIRDTIRLSYFSQTQLDGVLFDENDELLANRNNRTDYSKFEFIIYSQVYTRDTGAKVVRQEGTHKRTIHWVPSIQIRHAPDEFPLPPSLQ